VLEDETLYIQKVNPMVVTLRHYPRKTVQKLRMSASAAGLVLGHPPLIELVAGQLEARTHVYVDEETVVA
jgi:hypothetical protein